MPENLITPQEVRWYQENDPRWLTYYMTTVYDKDGIPTYIKAYKLNEALKRGFLIAPPLTEVEDGVKEPETIPEPMTGVVSERVFPKQSK